MKYLLDTNVLSELRRRDGSPRVRAWIDDHPDDACAISVISITEIESGLLGVADRDPPFAVRLRDGLERDILEAFEGRTLPVDLAAARHAARLRAPSEAARYDALIAGTALAHGLAVVTRNVRDFAGTGARVIAPWV